MKYRFLFLLIFIILSSCREKKQLMLWDFVDHDTPFVFDLQTIDSSRWIKNEFGFEKLRTQGALVVIQSISAIDYDFLYLISVSPGDFEEQVRRLKGSQQKISQRNYNGNLIYELTGKGLSISFSFIDGVFLYSESPILIEKAIRKVKEEGQQKIRSEREMFSGFSMVKEDDGNIFFKNTELLKLIPLPGWISSANELYQKNVLSQLDFKRSGTLIDCNGFSVAGEGSRLQYFQYQQAVPIQITRYVPSYSNYFFHFGISDFTLFNEQSIRDSTFTLASHLGDELILFNDRSNQPSMILEVNEELKPERINQLVASNAKFLEKVGDVDLYQLNSVNQFKSLFSKLNFKDGILFCSVKDNIILINEDVNELKAQLESIDRDDTWGKSLVFQNFLERGLQESNYSFFMKNIKLDLRKSTKLNLILQQLQMKQMAWFSIQQSALDNHFYSNLNVSLNQEGDRESQSVQYNFGKPIVSFHLIPVTKSINVLVEDETKNVHLIDNSDKIVWRYSLESRIMSDVLPIDYFNNRKVQFQIPTESNLNIIDRLGKALPNYPMELPDKFKFNGIVDYDKSGNYRFLFAKDNRIYLFDKNKKSLPGWNPKLIEGEILFTPKHYRIGGKDYFLVILKNGSVFLFTRRGDTVQGFPITTDARISGDYYLKVGASLQASTLTFTSNEGAVYQINLGSKVVVKNELVRSKEGVFALVNYQSGDGFSIIRMDPTTIAAFDGEGKLQFEISNPGSAMLLPEAFARKDRSILYSFFDPSQKLTYLYDQSGLLVSPSPIESTLPVKLIRVSESDQLYVANDTKIVKHQLQ